MKINHTRIAKVVALILTFIIAQVFMGLTLAAPGAVDKRVETSSPQAAAVLTTQGNKPITVNGASATSGATIVSGATIQTPSDVSAVLSIPGHGTLTIPANTRLTIEFDGAGNIQVMLAQGCVVLNTKKGTTGVIDNAQGNLGRSDGLNDATIDTCQTKTSPAAAGGGGLSSGAKVAIAAAVIGGGGAALAFGLRGSNPSPSSPR